MKVMRTSCWMCFSSICISWRSFRSKAPSGSSSNSTFGRIDERARERHTLALPPRELRRLPPAVFREPHHLERVGDPLAPLAPGPAHHEAVGDVLLHGHVREQRVVLEHGVDVPVVGARPRDVLPTQEDPARGRLLEAGDHPKARGLAGPGRPEHREELSLADVEVDPVDGDDVAEALGHAVEPHADAVGGGGGWGQRDRGGFSQRVSSARAGDGGTV